MCIDKIEQETFNAFGTSVARLGSTYLFDENIYIVYNLRHFSKNIICTSACECLLKFCQYGFFSFSIWLQPINININFAFMQFSGVFFALFHYLIIFWKFNCFIFIREFDPLSTYECISYYHTVQAQFFCS